MLVTSLYIYIYIYIYIAQFVVVLIALPFYPGFHIDGVVFVSGILEMFTDIF